MSVEKTERKGIIYGLLYSGAAARADLFKLMEVSRHKKPETVIGYVRESMLFENHAGEKFL